MHLNYRSRAAERGRTPAVPSYFLKPPSTLAADGADVALRRFDGQPAAGTGEVDGELLAGHARLDADPVGPGVEDLPAVAAEIDDEARLRIVAGEPHVAGEREIVWPARRRPGRAGAIGRRRRAKNERGEDDSEARCTHRHGLPAPLRALLLHYGRVVNRNLTGKGPDAPPTAHRVAARPTS